MSIVLDIEKRLENFHLKVELQADDEVAALLGASGCGKSLTLKCIAGIERPDRGRIVVDGEVLFDSEKGINLSPQKRRTGLMFQNYALFPNMTVEQNIFAGTKRYKDKVERKMRVRDIMERFELTELAGQLPSQLSGGQQQRTALARILVSDPQILMLDEPFSALDSHLRFRMEQEVGHIIRDFGRTVILVSHNRDEVFRLADKIAVMQQGQVDVYDKKNRVFADPKTRSACLLTGCKNISPIRKIDEHRVLAMDWGLELETAKAVGDASYIGIRHHDIKCIIGSGEACALETFAKEEYENNGHIGDEQARVQSASTRKDNEYDGHIVIWESRARNRFSCKMTSVTENPFSYTVMLRLTDQPQSESFGCEISREQWERWCMGKETTSDRQVECIQDWQENPVNDRMEILIPPESIMLLK